MIDTSGRDPKWWRQRLTQRDVYIELVGAGPDGIGRGALWARLPGISENALDVALASLCDYRYARKLRRGVYVVDGDCAPVGRQEGLRRLWSELADCPSGISEDLLAAVLSLDPSLVRQVLVPALNDGRVVPLTMHAAYGGGRGYLLAPGPGADARAADVVAAQEPKMEQSGQPVVVVSTEMPGHVVPERAAFEIYFASSRKSKGAHRRPTFGRRIIDDAYADDHTQRHWWTWQQAQAAERERWRPAAEKSRAALTDQELQGLRNLGNESEAAADEIANLRAALKWYADGQHFDRCDASAWDTVSGEPQNLWCDEGGTATVEDGSIAAAVLRGELTGAQVQAGAFDAEAIGAAQQGGGA